MAYKPGSFTKNFAWHGTGFAKLHDAIKAGYSGKLAPVTRDSFRQHCGVPERDLQLIPINFFLFNAEREGELFLEVDELVFQAIEQPHSLVFDRLALFALNVSEIGNYKAGGARWAREFVKERLWVNGFWKRGELNLERMREFIGPRLEARPAVLRKCLTNYRHLYELADYFGDAENYIENRDGTWLSSAIILAWDRAILSGALGATATDFELRRFIRQSDIHKLLGVPREFAESLAANLADAYVNHRRVTRFTLELPAPFELPGGEWRRGRRTSALELEEIAREAATSHVARKRREVEQQVRNRNLADELKRHYGSECMFCDSRVVVSISPEQLFAEAIHIRPLGRPHNGPDHPTNMLVLCPNCHVQFDAGTLMLIVDGTGKMRVSSKVKNHPLEGAVVETYEGHSVDLQYVKWHRNYWEERRR